MKYILRIAIIIQFLLCSNISVAREIRCSDWNCISDILKDKDKNTLLAITIENVMIEPQDQILKIYNRAYKQQLIRKLYKANANDVEDLLSIQIRYAKENLTDSKLLNAINIAKNRNVNLLFISHNCAGKYGQIESLSDLQIQKLRKFGIDISWSNIYHMPDLTLCDIDEKFASKKTSEFFTHGILFTCHRNIGSAIGHFIDKTKIKPQSIILIDYAMHHIDSVSDASRERNIKFYGVLYRENAINTLNQERANCQFDHLKTTRYWLGDDQADITLKSKLNKDIFSK